LVVRRGLKLRRHLAGTPARWGERSKAGLCRKQPGTRWRCLWLVDVVDTSMSADPARPAGSAADCSAAASAVTALYQQHAVGLIRLAMVMIGDRAAAEDVVQDAFFGLYRNWFRLGDPANALVYTRSSVLNGCRNALRTRARRGQRDHAAGVDTAPDLESAESQVLLTEEGRRMIAAIRKLPDRQREAIVLRFYLDMSEEEAANAMGVSRGTVKSTTSRAVAALGRMLEKEVW
jgi:RNA polymerase sigma-70 factor (sigma-E family)